MKETIPATPTKKPDAVQLDLSFDDNQKDFHGEIEEAYLNDHKKNIVDKNKKIEVENNNDGDGDIDFDDPDIFEKLEAIKEDDLGYYYSMLEKITDHKANEYYNQCRENLEEEIVENVSNLNNIDTNSTIIDEKEDPGKENWRRFDKFKNKMRQYSNIFKKEKTEEEKFLAKKRAIAKALEKRNLNNNKDRSMDSQDPTL